MKKIIIALLATVIIITGFLFWNFRAVVYVLDSTAGLKHAAKQINWFEAVQLQEDSTSIKINNQEYELIRHVPELIYQNIAFSHNQVGVNGFGDYDYYSKPKNSLEKFTKKTLKSGQVMIVDVEKDLLFSQVHSQLVFILNDFVVEQENFNAALLNLADYQVTTVKGVTKFAASDKITVAGWTDEPITFAEFKEQIAQINPPPKPTTAVVNNPVTNAAVESVVRPVANESINQNRNTVIATPPPIIAPPPVNNNPNPIIDYVVYVDQARATTTTNSISINSLDLTGNGINAISGGTVKAFDGVNTIEVALSSAQITQLKTGALLTPIVLSGLTSNTQYSVSFSFSSSVANFSFVDRTKLALTTDKRPPVIKQINFSKDIYARSTYQDLFIELNENVDKRMICEVVVESYDATIIPPPAPQPTRYTPVKITDTLYKVTIKVADQASKVVKDKMIKLTEVDYKDDCTNPDPPNIMNVDFRYNYSILKNIPIGTEKNFQYNGDSLLFDFEITDSDDALIRDVGSIEVRDSTGIIFPTITGYDPNSRYQTIKITGLNPLYKPTITIKGQYDLMDGKIVDVILAVIVVL